MCVNLSTFTFPTVTVSAGLAVLLSSKKLLQYLNVNTPLEPRVSV